MVIVILDIVLFISPARGASEGGILCLGGRHTVPRGGGILCFYIEGNSLRHFLAKMPPSCRREALVTLRTIWLHTNYILLANTVGGDVLDAPHRRGGVSPPAVRNKCYFYLETDSRGRLSLQQCIICSHIIQQNIPINQILKLNQALSFILICGIRVTKHATTAVMMISGIIYVPLYIME